jgi:SHS2 domain-containing protein
MSGAGLAAVKKRIEEAFNDVRTTGVESPEIDIEIIDDRSLDIMITESVEFVEWTEEVVDVEVIELEAEQDVEACFRDAEQTIQQHADGDHPGAVYYISVPREDSTTLIEQALRLIERKP